MRRLPVLLLLARPGTGGRVVLKETKHRTEWNLKEKSLQDVYLHRTTNMYGVLLDEDTRFSMPVYRTGTNRNGVSASDVREYIRLLKDLDRACD